MHTQQRPPLQCQIHTCDYENEPIRGSPNWNQKHRLNTHSSHSMPKVTSMQLPGLPLKVPNQSTPHVPYRSPSPPPTVYCGTPNKHNNNNELLMAPHLVRAWGTYKCLQSQAFITFTNMSTQLKRLRLSVIKDGQTGQKE